VVWAPLRQLALTEQYTLEPILGVFMLSRLQEIINGIIQLRVRSCLRLALMMTAPFISDPLITSMQLLPTAS